MIAPDSLQNIKIKFEWQTILPSFPICQERKKEKENHDKNQTLPLGFNFFHKFSYIIQMYKAS